MFNQKLILFILLLGFVTHSFSQQNGGLKINDLEYFEKAGLNVMMFHDYYSIGRQGGVTIVQNGSRVAANGDLRLWPMERPYPNNRPRRVDRKNNEITVQVFYNDSLRQKYTDQRYPYPEIDITCNVKVKGEGDEFIITVDLEEPLPEAWAGKLGFSLELFPGHFFERPYYMDDEPGVFPRPLNGPAIKESASQINLEPMAVGHKLVVLPDVPHDMITFESRGEPIELLDGRIMRNAGWYVIRSPLKTGVSKKAMEWVVKAEVQPEFRYLPVIQVSQVGYRTDQEKVAIIELDKRAQNSQTVSAMRISDQGEFETIVSGKPTIWGNFLRYKYARFDFTGITRKGIYKLKYGDRESNLFIIDDAIYKRHVWQPTLEQYLPVQMCHMRINDRVKVWHGLCHDDDALMAPTSHIHFDGYRQGTSTLTKYKPADQVPGLNVGGWHDAGDYDLRVESQANTVRILSYAWEFFQPEIDETTILQEKKIVEMHRPDGIPDILQQIEHGVLTIVAGYKALGRLYRGIICPTGRQYSLLGDGSVMTDNLKYDSGLIGKARTATSSSVFDDRWVFTEENPRRELDVAACLATAHRSLKGFNPELAEEALAVASEVWATRVASEHVGLIDAAGALYQSTGDRQYLDYIIAHKTQIVESIQRVGPAIARIYEHIKNEKFSKDIRSALTEYSKIIENEINETPYGVRYQPNIWGAGWNIQRFGVNQYFLHRTFPDLFSARPVFSAMNFVLGVHPGKNTASFVSGVGTNSLLVAYGVNRDDWSYIPGGSASGTALIRPDLPELKVWPYLWQQTEYVMGGGATNYMFLVLACDDLLERD